MIPLASCVVIMIMGWSNLHTTCPKLSIYHFISNDLELSLRDERMQKFLSYNIFEPWVFGVHSNSSISKHCLNSGSSYNYEFCGIFLQGVLKRADHSKLYLFLITWHIQ